MRRLGGITVLLIVIMFCFLMFDLIAVASTFIVNSTGDVSGGGVCDAAECTLREAINAANAAPNGALPDEIQFSIFGAGLHTIRPLSFLRITDPVVIDGYTQPGAAPATSTSPAVLMIELDGSLVSTNAIGLYITTGNSMVRGLVINRFSEGITANGSGNTVQGNFIGTDSEGIVGFGNRGNGVNMSGMNNTVGGTEPWMRNIISGNGISGVACAGDCVIQGNYIGTDVAGTTAIPNGGGVDIEGRGCLIGGTSAGARNIISGNNYFGVGITHPGTENVVQGNYIGTDVSGSVGLRNDTGILITDRTTYNMIGGTEPGAGNVISGNGYGISISWLSNGNVIQGNYIGTDFTGTYALPNTENGVDVNTSSDITIGGTIAGSGNVISGNGASGIAISGGDKTKGILVQGNFIGTDVTGRVGLGNGLDGIYFLTASDNVIGGAVPGAGNVVSSNGWVGISGVYQSIIQGNFIGTDVTGTIDLGNQFGGLGSGGNNTIGGTELGAGNVISGNGRNGIVLGGSDIAQGNFIGTDSTGSVRLGNDDAGISVGGSNNTIGGLTVGAGNTIAYNAQDGVVLGPSITSWIGNGILSNRIFANGDLGIDLGGYGVTLNDLGDLDTGMNDLQNFPVLTSATSSSNTTIEGTLNSTPNTSFRLEFFSNTECDSAGFGEGESLLGFTNVSTNASGNADFTVNFSMTIPTGHFITATATGPNNNTSEFSQCVLVAALQLFTLTVNKGGNGTGIVISSPEGINCGSTCSASYEVSTQVTLTATPSANSTFAGWGSDCNSTGQVIMTSDKTCTATFTLKQFALSVSGAGNGNGSISSSPAAISCTSTGGRTSGTCTGSYASGTVVTLTATPDVRSVFGSWTGCDAMSGNQCTVTMNSAKSVQVTFNKKTVALSVNFGGSGSGSVSLSPTSTDSTNSCTSTCSATYDIDSTIVLTATSLPGSVFASWSGCNSVSDTQCTVQLNSNQTVEVTFDTAPPGTFTLNVSLAGTGGGTVTSNPAGISCNPTCSGSFTSGTVSTLSATPNSSSAFSSWTGCDSTSGVNNEVCRITLASDRTVTASFRSTATQFRLTVKGADTGSGKVTGTGINCTIILGQTSGDCSEIVLQGTTLTLTAIQLEDSIFRGWSGCDAVASNSTTSTLGEAGAAPGILGWTILLGVCLIGLVWVGRPRGKKFVALAGVLLGLTVMLTACSGFVPIPTQCTVTMNADRTVTATFQGIRDIP